MSNNDPYGYITQGGYLGYSRTARRKRGNNNYKKWLKQNKENYNDKKINKSKNNKKYTIWTFLKYYFGALFFFLIFIGLLKA